MLWSHLHHYVLKTATYLAMNLSKNARRYLILLRSKLLRSKNSNLELVSSLCANFGFHIGMGEYWEQISQHNSEKGVDPPPPPLLDNLVSAIMGYNQYDLSKKKEVRWGVDHEDVAREAYIDRMTASHNNFSCRLAGFVVDDKKPFLGASADDIAACDCHGTRTVEIECPYKHKDRTPLEAAQIDSSFCSDLAGNLKSNHKYFSQMQLQMHVNRVLCGDFVIYTLKELKVNEMIPYDEQFTQAGVK